MKGTKPDFHGAMAPEPALALYNEFLAKLTAEFMAARAKAKIQSDKVPVLPGAFGQYMNINMTADGPVTLIWDSVKDAKAVAKLEKQKAREAKQAAAKAEKEARQALKSLMKGAAAAED